MSICEGCPRGRGEVTQRLSLRVDNRCSNLERCLGMTPTEQARQQREDTARDAKPWPAAQSTQGASDEADDTQV